MSNNTKLQDVVMKPQFTFFWESQSPFSQWHPAKFRDLLFSDIEFSCAEQYMMFRKARVLNDEETAQKVLETSDPRQQKALGRMIKNFNPQKWDDVKETVVYVGNFFKFTQNLNLKQQLLDTVGTTLVEASPYDTIWGIGLKADDPLAQNPKKWKGKNLLGKILTQLRDDLIAQRDNTQL